MSAYTRYTEVLADSIIYNQDEAARAHEDMEYNRDYTGDHAKLRFHYAIEFQHLSAKYSRIARRQLFELLARKER